MAFQYRYRKIMLKKKILTEKDIISKEGKAIYAGCVLCMWLMRKARGGGE